MRWSENELVYINSNGELIEGGSITDILDSLNSKYASRELVRSHVTRIFTLIAYLRFPTSFALINWEKTKGKDLRVCINLTSMIIGDSVTGIGWYAFCGCSSLTSVSFGENSQLIGIERSAFLNCRSLTNITFKGTVREWEAISKDEDWNYNVPATEVVCSDGKSLID